MAREVDWASTQHASLALVTVTDVTLSCIVTSLARVVASRYGVVFEVRVQCSDSHSHSELLSGSIRDTVIAVEALGMRAVAATLLARCG